MARQAIYRTKKFSLIKRGSTYFLQGSRDGQRYRVATGCDTIQEAAKFLDEYVANLDAGWHKKEAPKSHPWLQEVRYIHAQAKRRAQVKEVPFELTEADILELLRMADYRCVVSGIPFSRRGKDGQSRDPWAASIDRIESRHGYIHDNVRMVCMAANYAMNQWGRDTLLRLARGVIRCAHVSAPEPIELTPCVRNIVPNWHQAIDIIDETGRQRHPR